MRWTREQYLSWMDFRGAERPMFGELFGPLVGLEDEWRAQGATDDELNLTAFDFDYVQHVPCGGHNGAIDLQPRRVLEETATHRIELDGFGRRVQLDKRTATIGLPMDYPVQTMDDWQRLKHHFAYRADRVDVAAIEEAKRQQAAGKLVRAAIPGVFSTARDLMGEEVLCTAFYDQPELIEDLVNTLHNTAHRVLEQVVRRVSIDHLSVHEDMAGRGGPLVGPDHIRQWFLPYYRDVANLVRSGGRAIFSIDSDGNLNPIIDALLDCGLDELIPMEPAAGMDMAAVRRKYGPRLRFKGGIDKFAVMQGPAAIDRELDRKLAPEMLAGGVVFGLDHRIPNGTPLEHYRYYVRQMRQRLGVPPLDGRSKGWQRMAF